MSSGAASIDPMPLAVLLALALVGCGASSPPDPAAASQGASAERPSQPSSPQAEPPRDLQARYATRRALEVLRGRASYYSDRLAGRTTANGDRYDPRAFTAASRDLAFGTIVRVIREDTGASVIVRINDRGPHRDRSRILDLSRAAAERLDMIRAGVVSIRAEIVEVPERRRR